MLQFQGVRFVSVKLLRLFLLHRHELVESMEIGVVDEPLSKVIVPDKCLQVTDVLVDTFLCHNVLDI